MPKEDIRYTFSATRQSQHTEYDIEMHTNTVETIGTHAHTHTDFLFSVNKNATATRDTTTLFDQALAHTFVHLVDSARLHNTHYTPNATQPHPGRHFGAPLIKCNARRGAVRCRGRCRCVRLLF